MKWTVERRIDRDGYQLKASVLRDDDGTPLWAKVTAYVVNPIGHVCREGYDAGCGACRAHE